MFLFFLQPMLINKKFCHKWAYTIKSCDLFQLLYHSFPKQTILQQIRQAFSHKTQDKTNLTTKLKLPKLPKYGKGLFFFFFFQMLLLGLKCTQDEKQCLKFFSYLKGNMSLADILDSNCTPDLFPRFIFIR